MQKYFEKIKERLDNIVVNTEDGCYVRNEIRKIVNNVAEEYSHRNADLVIGDSRSNDGWIPCSEKTPEFEIYSVTRLWVTMHRKGCGFYFVRTLRWNGYKGRWEWDNGKTLSDAYEVVAWREMVVPAPYQPKGE